MECFYCRGHLEKTVTSHVVTMGNRLLIVKNVPCTKCEQCGETYFNDEIADKLEQIIKQLRSAATEIAVVNYQDAVA